MTTLFRRAAVAAWLPLALATGCDSADPAPADATLALDVQATVGAAPFVAGQTFTLNGRAAQLETARLYLSDLTLLHEDGREVALTDSPITVRARLADGAEAQRTITERYVLATPDSAVAPTALGAVPAGRYTGLRFTVGVNGDDNRIAAEDAPAEHPLAPQTPSMYWTWASGYVFVRLDGLLDVTGDGVVDPATDTPGDPASGQWRLHIGQTANAQTVTLAAPFALAGGADQTLRLGLDLARLVQGIDYGVPANRFCMTFGCQPVVDAAKANLGAAFTVRGVSVGA